ncbi:polyketide synthase Pks13 [Williamsia sterculiae]|uniref:Polyketide synthase 13 n=1 Tax=Williamsia sterculiae TaxID=1344003 RepID=A0A1N7H8J7_9NOCA|nr:polyketide synthase Pks13 [Williamsia sterculiae]SIS21142.1 polyketide synthase 13 [Williamsia sterculiae]
MTESSSNGTGPADTADAHSAAADRATTGTAGVGTVGETAGDLTVAELRDWLRGWVADATGMSPDQIADDRPMEEFGLSSRDAVALGGDIEDKTGVVLTATVVYQHPTIATLAKRIIEGDPDEGLDTDEDATFYQRERGADDDIAIVGLATRFPKAGLTPDTTWDALITGRDGITDLPADRWTEFKADPHINGILQKANLHGGYLDDVKGFDADFFQMSPREAEMVDPQQRLALELTWEALEHAHIPASDLKGEQVGVFIGSSTNDYQMLAVADPESTGETAAYALTGTSTSVVPGRVSYFYDFRGPSVAIDTACSTSLVAIHQAVRSLRSGESDLALAGGVNMLITPAATLGFDSLGVQAKDGRIKAFSSDADGMIRAEGGGLVVLKRLADARRDGDKVLAVVAGSAVNSDGRSNGLPAPNPEAQVEVLRSAYRDAAIDPRDVDYIEAHGTGTILGDPIETDALGRVVGRGRADDKPALLGSVKTNFGHLEAAAGSAGIAKVVLALQHDELPPSLNYAGPNPYIQFDQAHLRVVGEGAAWPRYSGHAVAGISGFGFGGTNAHVVVREVLPSDLVEPGVTSDDEVVVAQAGSLDVDDDDDEDFLTEAERAALGTRATAATPAPVDTEQVDPADGFAPCAVEGAVIPLVISGFLASRRRKAAADLADWLETDEARDTPLVDIGRALAHRNHGRTRSVVMARDHDEALSGMRAVAAGKASPTVFTVDSPDAASAVWLLSGFGSQHRKMGKQLYQENPVFARAVDQIDGYVHDELGYSIVEMFLDDGQTYGIETSQVGIFTIQVGLAELLRHHGAEPGVLVPHSMGEATASYISGGLSLEDAVRVICQRSRLMGEGESMLTGDNIRLMALVEYSADDITTVLSDYPDLEICVYAAPTHTVVGGPEDQVDAVVARAESEGKLGRKLQTKGASHTSQMDPLLGELAYELTGIEPMKPTVGFYSSIDRETFYRPGSEPVHTIEYFTKGLRHSVWFSQAIAKSVENGHTTFLELSPNPAVLISVAAVTFGAGLHNAELIETLRRKEDENVGVITALMKLYVHGHSVNVGSLFGAGEFANIPRTRFDRKPYWLTAHIGTGSGSAKIPGAHVALPDGRHVWEVSAAAVTDPRVLVKSAADSVLGEVTVGATEQFGEVPAAGTLTTTLNPHPGGASVHVHINVDGAFRPLLDAVVTGAARADSAAPTAAAIPEVSAPAAAPGVVVDKEVVDEISGRWDPNSGESVANRLAVIVGESMGYEPEDLPREIPLIELGLDSLMAVRIKNRVEYEFDIPQLQLQAMRQANLDDVTKFVSYAVEHRDEVAALAEGAAGQGDLDTEKLAAIVDGTATPESLAAEATTAGTDTESELRQAVAEQDTADTPPAGVNGVGHFPAAAEAAAERDLQRDIDAAPGHETPETLAAEVVKQETQTENSANPPAGLGDQITAAAAAGADVPPRDAAERLTFGVWAVVTGKSAGGIFNPLPVLDNATADKLTQRLSERAGGEIDVEDVVDSDTIETLADYVRVHMEDSAPVDGFVRYLRVPEGKRTFTADDPTPMLVFHPAGASTAAYEPLLRRLPEDQWVVGFDRVEGSIEERVREYLPRLREVQPHGPYVLVGWSLGGALAFGCAKVLREEGEEVAFVGLIDVVRPSEPEEETPETKRARLERWAEFARRTYGVDDVPLPMDRLVEADDEGQFKIIMEMLAMSNAKIPGGIIEHQRTSFLDNRALVTVRPTEYDGAVVLYRADKMHDGAVELEPQWAEIDEDGGWGEFIDDLEIVHVGGDHLSIIDEPYIAIIGADLTDRLNKIGH